MSLWGRAGVVGSSLQCEQQGGRPPSRAGTGRRGAGQWVDSPTSMKTNGCTRSPLGNKGANELLTPGPRLACSQAAFSRVCRLCAVSSCSPSSEELSEIKDAVPLTNGTPKQ